MIGLVAGTVVGAGLTMWLAPRAASELQARVTDSAKRLSKRASRQYEQASALVGETVDEITRKSRGVRDGIAGAVVHGASRVERFATASMSDAGRPAPAAKPNAV